MIRRLLAGTAAAVMVAGVAFVRPRRRAPITTCNSFENLQYERGKND